MANVDPFVVPIPPNIRAQSPDFWNYLQRFLHDLWVRSGGGNDELENEGVRELFSWQNRQVDDDNTTLSSLFGAVNQSISSSREVITTSDDFTTTTDQVIVCTNTSPITVTLNANPGGGETVTVKRQNTGAVTVSGIIDGKTAITLLSRYDAPDLVYIVETNEWAIV